MYPTRTFADFPLSCDSAWKYLSSMRFSFFQRLQNSLVILVVLWWVFLRFSLPVGIVEGGAVNFAPQIKCVGVNASSASCVMGREFKTASTLRRVVLYSSSVAMVFPSTFRRHLFVVQIVLSHQPPH